MSVQRNASTPSTEAERSGRVRAPGDARAPAPTRAVDAFREAMQRAGATDVQAPRERLQSEHARDEGLRRQAPPTERSDLPGLEAATTAMLAPAAAPQAPAGPGGPDPQAIAALIERHVRQLFVSEGGLERDSGDVLLRLDESTLPGTDLILRREGSRWRLEAQVGSRGVLEQVNRFAPELAARFAARGLGDLQVVSSLRAPT